MVHHGAHLSLGFARGVSRGGYTQGTYSSRGMIPRIDPDQRQLLNPTPYNDFLRKM